ncbi:cation antiporter (Na+/Ca2+) [Stappia aggregata IAM 12614]|uniref:Cation antiporter (Na+/Ca2+) n=1 Tax=Roseibium aggregatum (strain ATCC 25650 / DSM 13394 / JCM 20685 / NBRC 16684 / NCIMB 2208 / IAM 12614 / B1) TaxID=384765 RepID=A0P3W7_ROSAI|nr:cation transporter [Roseibium aggregatum]EAV40263.1 cation antiporter (Na+/Ca2+) [Stappia aggregata IAM 12614] [Roseibium aggregatum IAM 12614]
MSFDSLPLWLLLAIFAAAGGVILVCGIRLTGQADRIADRTGLGEALVGGVLLGAATSLSGTVVSVTAALDGRASLAFSNGVGGIAAQTAFLAIADIVYRRANLEHVAADVSSLFQCALLVLLLSIPMVAYTTPEITFLGIHPASYALVIVYFGGVMAQRRVHEQPMWQAVHTSETHEDSPDEAQKDMRGNMWLIGAFAGLMLVLATMGWVLAEVAGELTDRFDLNASLVGALMTAVVTSLPELVTTLAAVHRGALQLAIGGIVGGNTFDTLFLTLSDVAYRDGSIYHAVSSQDYFWLTIGLVMTAILLLGLLVRQKSGPGGIGFESVSLLGVYGGAIALQAIG